MGLAKASKYTIFVISVPVVETPVYPNLESAAQLALRIGKEQGLMKTRRHLARCHVTPQDGTRHHTMP